jgi:phage terminase Nu1 subunit (DNA packaging protein)
MRTTSFEGGMAMGNDAEFAQREAKEKNYLAETFGLDVNFADTRSVCHELGKAAADLKCQNADQTRAVQEYAAALQNPNITPREAIRETANLQRWFTENDNNLRAECKLDSLDSGLRAHNRIDLTDNGRDHSISQSSGNHWDGTAKERADDEKADVWQLKNDSHIEGVNFADTHNIRDHLAEVAEKIECRNPEQKRDLNQYLEAIHDPNISAARLVAVTTRFVDDSKMFGLLAKDQPTQVIAALVAMETMRNGLAAHNNIDSTGGLSQSGFGMPLAAAAEVITDAVSLVRTGHLPKL